MNVPSMLSRFAQRHAAGFASALIWGLSLLIVAWIVSGWIWSRAAPAPAALPIQQTPDPLIAAQGIASRHLMGEHGNSPTGAPPGSARQFQLLGTMTSSGSRPGFAILSESGAAPLAVVEGEEFAPGLTLSNVLPGRALLLRRGRTESLEMARSTMQSASQAGDAPPASSSVTAPNPETSFTPQPSPSERQDPDNPTGQRP